MNAGAALYIGGKAESMKDGIALAAELIDSGKALETLERFIAVSNPRGGERMSIFDKLAAHARERVLADSENMSLDILQAMCRETGRANGARFYDAL